MPLNIFIEQSRNIEVFYNVTYDVYNAFNEDNIDENSGIILDAKRNVNILFWDIY